MDRAQEFQRLLMTTFQAELEDHLGTLNKGLLALEQDAAALDHNHLLAELFRAAHSLKGAARAVDIRSIEAIAHKLEDALGIIRKEALTPTSDNINALLAALDAIKDAMAAHLRGEEISSDSLTQLFVRLSPLSQTQNESFDGEDNFSRQPEELQQIENNKMVEPHEHVPDAKENPPPQMTTAAVMEISTKPTARAIITDETIRVSTAKLDSLMDSLGELMVARMRMEQMMEQVKTIQQGSATWQKSWRKVRPTYDRFRRQNSKNANVEIQTLMRFIENNELELKTISSALNSLSGHLTNDRNHLQLVTDTLQNGIRNVRMLPISTLFDNFPRMVRDLALERKKDVILSIDGADTEVDRQALEMMKDPIMHLLRNAVDHGIELPAQRIAFGKPGQGNIHLSAEQRGNNLILAVSDDGRGIDTRALKQAGMERGIIAVEEAEKLNEVEAINLIFRPGLSTASQLSDISGRGVGMDVVRDNLEQLHGLIHVTTGPGKGATFTLTLPLTLATHHVLLLRAAGETLALPMMNVERILRIGIDKIGSLNGKPAVFAEGYPLPLISLAHLLHLPVADKPMLMGTKIPVVILRVVEKRIALRVDRFLSTQEVVVKNLGRQLRKVNNVTGATILGDGQLVIILNVADLMKSIEDTPISMINPAIAISQIRKRRVMVVDDSITTRMLEKHILVNAGYQAITAADGKEALELIRSNMNELPALVVSDVNMPNLDGFVLTETIKGDPSLASIPVVLVTSLESQQDKIRGLEAGADAYIVKKSFDQRELLEMIDRLIG